MTGDKGQPWPVPVWSVVAWRLEQRRDRGSVPAMSVGPR